MGMPTMRNLIAAGHDLTVFDLDPEALRVAAMQGKAATPPPPQCSISIGQPSGQAENSASAAACSAMHGPISGRTVLPPARSVISDE